MNFETIKYLFFMNAMRKIPLDMMEKSNCKCCCFL